MDAEQKAINDMFAAYQKLRALGWNDAVYCPKDGTVFETIEAGSTGIHRTHYSGKWPDGSWWVHDAGDLWPSRPILFRVIQDASNRDRSSEAAETSGSAEGKSPAPQGATPAQTPPSPPSATPEGDPPMTVEEAREVLNSFDTHVWPNPADYVSFLRKIACEVPHRPQYQQSCRTFASRIELALRTLHAAGEVR